MKKLLIALISAAVLSLAAFELGKSPCTIYHIARNALQAKEMAAFLRKVYGQQYTVKLFREKYRKSPGIFIGVRPAGLQMEFDESREYCVRHIAGDQLYLFGNQDIRLKGTAFAVYDFLEEVCGVRYLWPGELGTVADPAKPVTLKDSTEKRVPFFIRRMVNSYHYGINSLAGRDAYALNRWQEHHRVGTSCFGSAAHAFAALLPREKYGKTHPEYYSLVSPAQWIGKNKPDKPTRRNDPLKSGPWQLCTSNPDVRRIIAEKIARQRPGYMTSISPNDGFGFCECAKCVAQDGKPRPLREYGVKDMTNRMYDFAADIAWQAHKLNPKSKIGMFAYSFYDGVPDGNVKFPPDTMFLSFCYIISFMNAEEEAALEKSIRGLAATGAKVHGREYWNTHYFFDYPLAHSRKIARNIKVLYECNAAGITGEPGNAFAPKAADLYILMKLVWDPTLKREDLLMDFCKKGFGEKAAPVMYELFEKIEDWTERLTNNFAQHRGENYHHYDNLYAARLRGMAWCYDREFQKMCEIYYAKALKLADTPERKERIRYIRRGTRYAQYVTDALNGYSDLAAAGVNMALTQPSGKIIRMEKKNLIKLADRVIKAGNAHRSAALRNSYDCGVSIMRVIIGENPVSRPWLFFARKMRLDLTGGNFNYLVNGAFEYNNYSWKHQGTGGAVLTPTREDNHDNEYNFKAVCHGGQGISLLVTLPGESSAELVNERKISPEEPQTMRFQLFVKCDTDPRKYMEVEFAGRKLTAFLLPPEAEDGSNWHELRFKSIEVPAGDHTFRIKFRNSGKSEVRLCLDDLVLKMREKGK